MKLFRNLYQLAVFSIFMVLSSCSVEKNTGLSRNYHNIISHYNIYFNGNESFKRGLRKIDQNFKDDYYAVLPIFKYGNKSIASMIAPDMDRAIAKASKLITLHSITAKPEMKKKELTEKEKAFFDQPEFNNWVDDSYLMMGKAQALKQDYFLALKTLQYLTGSALDKKTSVLAQIWMARIYNEQKNFEKALEILNILQDDLEFPKDLKGKFYSTFADFYLKQDRYIEAIPIMQKLVGLPLKKGEKTRFLFILAQISEKTGNEKAAFQYYHKVLKLNPDYEMTFNTHILQAQSLDMSLQNATEIKKNLKKMLRDEKNKEYRDQIYYAFGEIALKENKKEEAIDNFKKSARVSVSNNKQKGISYLSIANLYFSDEKYVDAQAFYDSALSVISSKFPDYDLISVKARSLNKLVKQITIVETQDSLQRIAAMSPSDQIKFIDNLIRKLKEDDQKKKEQETKAQSQYNPSSYYESEQRIRQELSKSGKWYFYNPAVVGYGRTEFKKKWGDRKLEDNWRRMNKSISEMNLTQSQGGSQEIKSDSSRVNQNNKYNRKVYLKNLPVNDSLLAISNREIEEALYAIGQIYMEDLKDFPRAISTFEDYVTRFPEASFLPIVYFDLYSLYQKTNQSTRAGVYKGLLLSKFPDNEYAKILSDPDYLRKRNEKEQEVYRKYEHLYSEFLRGHLPLVIEQCDSAIIRYPQHKLNPKFRLLRAYATGKLLGVRAFKNSLQDLVKKVPAGEEKKRASELITYFNSTNPVLKKEDEVKESIEIYHFSADEIHMVVLAIEKKNLDANQLVFNIINFNLDHFPESEFETKKLNLDNRFMLITISGTGKLNEARLYLQQLQNDPTLEKDLLGKVTFNYIISSSNFKAFLKNKSIPVYENFYKKYYLETRSGEGKSIKK